MQSPRLSEGATRVLSYSLFYSIAFARIETTNSKEEVIAIMEKLRQVDRLLEVENFSVETRL